MTSKDDRRVTIAARIGRNIKRLRGSMTQVDFAESVGTKQACISRWELGKEIPRVESLDAIAIVCKVNVGDIITTELKGEIKAAPVKAVKAPAKKPDKLAKKIADRAALDKPDLPAKPKRSHSKKAAPVTACDPAPVTDAAPAEVVNE
jgi:transcriptional regulator with XRE-family HTH domain